MKYFYHKSIRIIILAVISVLGCFIFVIFFQGKGKTKDKTLNNAWKVIAENAVKKYVGTRLVLPYTDSVNLNENEYQKICKLPIKIVCFADANCRACLLKISFWDEFIKELRGKGYNNFHVIIYAYSSLEENLRYYMKSNWSYFWQFDKKEAFIGINGLKDSRLQTVLLDSENKVLLIGDPLLNPKLRELYIKVIKSVATKSKVVK